MKKYYKVVLVFLCIFLFSGCAINNDDDDSISLRTPKNNILDIVGVWKVDNYLIKDSTLGNQEQIDLVSNNNIVISDKYVGIGKNIFKGVRYKVKIVNGDYTIGYSPKLTVADLGIVDNDTAIYTITYQNNILAEVMKLADDKVYLDYSGVLFTLQIDNTDGKEKYDLDEKREELKSTNKSNIKSEGVYIGLKSSSKESEDIEKEKYRTVWINTKDGQLQDIKERENIIFPRLKGIWEIDKKLITNSSRNIYYEYFDAYPIEMKNIELHENLISSEIKITDGTFLRRSINFVGNDYIATDVIRKGTFISSPSYEVLPVDNLNTETPVVISDIYSKDVNKIYTTTYENEYNSVDEQRRNSLSKWINYSNFTLVRESGRWNLQGRISAINNEEGIEYPLNIVPNKNLVNYDTLIIPWKVLKSKIPYLKDAFISPNGNLAIIVLEEEFLIYKINNGVLDDNPEKRVKLEDGESIIMAEWCEGDYVDKWGSVFNENSRLLE